jgi:hypothetical protein
VLLVGLRIDWLRREEAMKTTGRENRKRYGVFVASRGQGTEGKNNPAQWGGLDGKKKSGHRRSVFFLTPFIELIGHLKDVRAHNRAFAPHWRAASRVATPDSRARHFRVSPKKALPHN